MSKEKITIDNISDFALANYDIDTAPDYMELEDMIKQFAREMCDKYCDKNEFGMALEYPEEIRE